MSAIPSRAQIDSSTAGANCTTAPCVTTYHNDAQRDGVNSQESLLVPSVFNLNQTNSRFGLLGSTPASGSTALDGLVYAQPLYLHGVQMSASSGCFQGINTSTTISGSPETRGTAAFWAGPASSPQNYMYLGGSGSALIAYQASTTNGSFSQTGDPEKTPKTYPYPGTTPSVSWDGSTTGSGVVWAIDSGGYGSWTTSSSATKAAVLVAYQAVPQMSGGSLTLAELWASSESVSQTGPGAVKFTVPTVADGLVFVAGGKVGDAPGPTGGTGVNCTASALVNTSFSNVCLGQMTVYGLLKSQ